MIQLNGSGGHRLSRRPFFLALVLILAGMPFLPAEGRATGTGQFDRLPIYQLQASTVTKESAEETALVKFGVEGEAELIEGHWVVRAGTRTVDVNVNSGGAWFAEESQLWNPEMNPQLPDVEQAQTLATTFVTENELVPSSQVVEPVMLSSSNGDGTRMATMTVTANGHLLRGASRQLDQQVTFGLRMVDTDLPVVGGGGEFSVSVGDKGNVIGYSGVWRRTAGSIGEYEVLPPPTAEEAFSSAVAQGMQVMGLEAELAYYSAPNPETQNYLYPVYVMRAMGQVGTETFPLRNTYARATTFSPAVQITSPTSGVTVDLFNTVTMTATVMDGTPPYTITWESNVDGLLGTGETVTAALSPLPKVGMGFGSHNIQATVVDANGMTAVDTVDVTVEGVQVMLPLVAAGTTQARVAAPQDGGDEGIAEAATSWIGELGGLGGSRNNAGGFVTGMRNLGWRINFDYGNTSAFHSDWTTNDDRYIDAADFIFYTGHANLDGWQAAQTGGDGWVSWDEAAPAHSPRDLWGSDDLEWLVIAACGPLQDNVISPGGGDVFARWANAFDGLHLLLGYGAVSNDNTTEGSTLVNYMRSGRTIVDSWFRTARDIQPSTNGWSAPNGPTVYSGVMYVTQPGRDPFNDRLPGFGAQSLDPTSPTQYAVLWSPS